MENAFSGFSAQLSFWKACSLSWLATFLLSGSGCQQLPLISQLQNAFTLGRRAGLSQSTDNGEKLCFDAQLSGSSK